MGDVICYGDVERLKLQVRLVKKRGIDGIALWHLGSEDPAMWEVVQREFLG